MNLRTALAKIKGLEIQGAENIAIASAQTIKALAQKQSYKQLLNAKERLIRARPTEPCTHNTLNYVFSGTKEPIQIAENAYNAIKHLAQSKARIAELGSKQIRDGDTVFTHCHSSTVLDVLKMAKAKGKNFQVYNTETRPLYQGRAMAKELVSAGIKTTLFVDSAARIAIKGSDIMLIGCDAITADAKVINKVGSEMFAEIAKRHGTDVFVCSDSWKFDPNSVFQGIKIEQRAAKEVWAEAPKQLKISNYAFERIDPDLITAIISELGILAPEVFVSQAIHEHNWIC